MLIVTWSVCQTVESGEQSLNILWLNRAVHGSIGDASVYSIYSTFAGNSIQQPHKTYRIKASIEFLESYQV